MWKVSMWCGRVFMQFELNCWKLRSNCLSTYARSGGKSCRKMQKMQALQDCQFPCLGPAAIVAVNSVDVEVTSSGVPVRGGEFG